MLDKKRIMGNFVVTILSLTIGFFFILVGTLKLTPAINEEVYRQLRKTFIRSARVFPLTEYTGFRPNPHALRRIVGVNEVVCGILLAIIPGPLKQVANLILFVLMLGTVYTHVQLKDGLDKMTPALVFTMLLACRYIVYLQVRARQRRAEQEALKKTE